MQDHPSVDDTQLIQEAQGGNTEAFGELYLRYASCIFRFLYAHLDDRRDAEDLTEDVFLRSWRSLRKYRDQGLPFRAFLYRIAQNALIDFYRTNGQVQWVEGTEIDTLMDEAPEPGAVTATKMEHQELRRTLKQLPKDYQIVLIARFLSGLSPEETAQLMGKPVGTVRVLQHRALAAIRKLMNGIQA